MGKNEKEEIRKINPKYILIGVFVLIFILSLIILRPFILPIVYAVILTYLFYPIFSWIEKRIRRRKIASLITTLIIVMLIFLPFMLLVQGVVYETKTIYSMINDYSAKEGDSIDRVYDEVNKVFGTNLDFKSNAESIKKFIQDNVKNFIFSIPRNVISFLIIVLLTYSFLLEGNKIVEKTQELINLDTKYSSYIIKSFKDITNSVVYGQVLTGIVQGVLGILAFFIFGVPSPFFWGLVMGVIAIIPLLGAWIIWAPTAIGLIFQGMTASDPTFVWRGIGLFLFGILIISMVDNIIKPILISSKTKIHPILVLIGVFGGIYSFGFIGVVIGPWVLELLVGFWEILQIELSNKKITLR